MAEITPYIHRDISWLGFNYRVLQEAKDPNVPLMDRIKFMAIYSSNLDEFFRVRVANHRNLDRTGKKTRKTLGFQPAEILKQILKIVNEQQLEYSDIFFKQILPDLRKEGIHVIRRQEMTDIQRQYVEDYFTDNMLPYVQPVLLLKQKIKPFLNNGSLYLALQLKDIKTSQSRYAVVQVPSDQMERFVELPSPDDTQRYIIMLDDIVRHSIAWIFPGFHIIESYSIKLTRDAELYIDDEFSGDLLEKIRKSLNKRKVGPASRLVYDRTMPEEFLSYLMRVFDLTEYDLLPEGRYHNNSDFFGFPNFGLDHLSEAPLAPIHVHDLEQHADIFEQIRKKDHFVYPPYHSYESVIRFFEKAAVDPDVSHIKIVQYRVAKRSRIMNALMEAVRQGKHVTTFIEIKARFDEEANLGWGETLEKAGVEVIYSMPGIKVHAKVASVIRREHGEDRVYSYFSTGNFNEQTARVYSDMGIFTADERLTLESVRLFNYLETKNKEGIKFEHLLVGMFNLNTDLDDLIQKEVELAKAGKPAKIVLKMNSLQEPNMIEKLYAAGKAGVKIDLIIRGICSLVPGIKDISDNIQAVSIVDRFLEHSRVFIFNNGGDPKYYLSSADWMYRNLHRRIEIILPVYNPDIKEQINDLIELQLKDNVKARSLNHNQVNEYIINQEHAQTRSQMESYLYVKRRSK